MSTRDGAAPDAPERIDHELLEPEASARAPRRKKARVSDFPLDTQWVLTDPDVLALNRDEFCALIKVIAITYQSSTPGIMNEEQLRIWSGYTPDEWTVHRAPMLRLFRALPDARLVLMEVRRVFRKQDERVRKARRGAIAANRERWKRGQARGAPVVRGVARSVRSEASSVRKRASEASDRSPSVLSSQGYLPTVPPTASAGGQTPPAEVLPDAAAVTGLVALVGARLGRGGASA